MEEENRDIYHPPGESEPRSPEAIVADDEAKRRRRWRFGTTLCYLVLLIYLLYDPLWELGIDLEDWVIYIMPFGVFGALIGFIYREPHRSKGMRWLTGITVFLGFMYLLQWIGYFWDRVLQDHLL